MRALELVWPFAVFAFLALVRHKVTAQVEVCTGAAGLARVLLGVVGLAEDGIRLSPGIMNNNE